MSTQRRLRRKRSPTRHQTKGRPRGQTLRQHRRLLRLSQLIPPKLTLANPLQTRTTASALFALKGPPTLCWWMARCTHRSSSQVCSVDLYLAEITTTDVEAEGKRTKTLLARGVPPTPTEQTRVNRPVAPPAMAAAADPGIGVAMTAQAIEA